MSSVNQIMRIGETLLNDGSISGDQLTQALADQKGSGQKLGELMVEKGLITGSTLVRALAACQNLKGCLLRHGLVDPALFDLIGAEEAARLLAVPMFKVHDTLTVAMAEPQSLPLVDRLRGMTGCRIRPILALEANIREYIDKYASGDVNVDEFLTSLTESDVQLVENEAIDEGPVTNLDKMAEGSPIVNLVNVAILTAVRDRSSDIHVEPEKKGTRIRYRIDGVLRNLMKPPPGIHASVTSRIKVMANMDIAEKRMPQEGRIRIMAERREIDIRVSSMPTLLGEKIVMRILDKENLHVQLEELGFRAESYAAFKRMLEQPHGLVLVTGPTGSGKTTTLYSALDLLRSPERNLITVEDPVEYQLDLVNQIQVHQAINLTFAKILRSVLRQDPDVIMVGEIRDNETAHVAVQAALTGHLVLATLHTNDAAGAVARLLDMDIESYLLSSALNGAVAQRLARMSCTSCETRYYPEPHVLLDAGLPVEGNRSFHKGSGCSKCHNSGYKGRVGIYEVMEVTPELRRLIHRAAPSYEIRQLWQQQGGLSLREEGVRLAMEGRSCLEEVLRVTHDEGGFEEPAKSEEAVSPTVVDSAERGAA